MAGFWVTLICLLVLPYNGTAKYVEGQINDPVQVSFVVDANQNFLKLLYSYFTEMGIPCTILLLVNGRDVFL